jgi:hypothetical protein
MLPPPAIIRQCQATARKRKCKQSGLVQAATLLWSSSRTSLSRATVSSPLPRSSKPAWFHPFPIPSPHPRSSKPAWSPPQHPQPSPPRRSPAMNLISQEAATSNPSKLPRASHHQQWNRDEMGSWVRLEGHHRRRPLARFLDPPPSPAPVERRC